MREASLPVTPPGATDSFIFSAMDGSPPHKNGPTVSIVVPVYNKRSHLVRAIDSLVATVRQFGSAELILVDNDSTDGSYELLVERYDKEAAVTQLRGGTISAVRNHGAAIARGTYLSFVDCDCVVPPDFISRLVAVFRDHGVSVTGCAVGLPANPSWIEEVWHRLHRRADDGFRSYINSGNFAVHRVAFEAVHGFDESLITGEDAEICQRLGDAGFHPYEAQSLAVAHLDNPKTLAEFYRKEVWRGLGMLGTVRFTSLDRPTAMTVTHLAAIVCAFAAAAAVPSWPARVAALLVLPWIAPIAAVAYRARTTGRVYRPARAVLLYQVYFLARITALGRIALGALRPRRNASTGQEATKHDQATPA